MRVTQKIKRYGIFTHFSRLKKQEEEDGMELLALVIEPDAYLRRLVREALHEDGWQVVEARTADEALTLIRQQQNFPLIYCADSLRTDESKERAASNFISSLRSYLGSAAYIVMIGTENGSEAALESILSGASDYLRGVSRPDDVRRYARIVKQRLQAAKEITQPGLSVHPMTVNTLVQTTPDLIGSSEAIVSIFKKIAKSISAHCFSGEANGAKKFIHDKLHSFFITGETGTGKELIAHLIHDRSIYAGGAFVPINCSALPEALAESELFGYEPGAFTGATKKKKGLWEIANGGTLFLDEITEAPRAILPKLLRVLQEGKIKRLGSNHWTPVDVQVIAASNRDIKTEVRQGRFREDLYHRLSLFELHLPPLRERREDIPLLIAHFARRYAVRSVYFSQDAIDLMTEYSWPGNVRELENTVRAAIAHTVDGSVYAVDLLPRFQIGNGEAQYDKHKEQDETEQQYSPQAAKFLEAQVKEFKLKTVKEALRQHRGNITRTAAALGLTRPTLYKILKELDSE